ncbi:hypothetical protein BsWGS_18370 [Bradybaena similaris]
MNIIAHLLLLISLTTAQEEEIQVLGPERVQEFHACVGSNAYIPWPLNVMSRTGHKTTVIYLFFQRWHSDKKMLIATFSGQHELTTYSHFKNRMIISSENSGIFLQQTSMDDAGTYTAQARVNNGQVWTRSTNLTVLLRPIIFGGRINVSKSEVILDSNSGNNCVNLTCGTLEYAGYPPVTFVWTTKLATLLMKTAADDFVSLAQICSPYTGDVVCSIAGFSSICTYDHVASVHIDLPELPSNRSTATKSAGVQDLALTIIMPILAVLVPLAILGVWVLSHIFKSYPQYREQRHLSDREPQVEIDIEENGATEQTHDNDGQSEEEGEQTEIKEDIGNIGEETSPNGMGNHNSQHHHDVGIIDDNTEDDEGKANEDKPLMNASISTAV